MLCGLFMLIDGNPTFLTTVKFVASTAVAVPGFVFCDIFSNWVSTQTCPTPGLDGGTGAARFLGSLNLVCRKSLRFGTGTGLPFASKANTETGGYDGLH